MKRSEIYLEAAQRVLDVESRKHYFYTAIGDASDYEGGASDFAYSYFGSTSIPVESAAVRVLALCFLSAIAKTERRCK